MKKRKQNGILTYEFDIREFNSGKGLSAIKEIKDKYLKKGIDIQLLETDYGAYKIEIDTKNRNLTNSAYPSSSSNWRKSQKVPRSFLRKTRTAKNELEGYIRDNQSREYGDYITARNYQKFRKGIEK